MFRALRSPQQKPRSPGLRRTKNAVGRYLFRKKRLPHRVDLADWRFEARLAHYRRLQIGAARPLVVFWQTRPAPVPIVGAISAHKPQGAGPLGGGIASACVVYLRLTRQAYGSAHGRRRSAPHCPFCGLPMRFRRPPSNDGLGSVFPSFDCNWCDVVRNVSARGDFRTRLASARAGLTILQFASGSL